MRAHTTFNRSGFVGFAAAVSAIAGLGVSPPPASAMITIPTVPIGNPGNAANLMSGLGSVPYAYNIGQTEVTNAQYTAFLNAVAKTDTNGLYSTSMANGLGGIARSGVSGAYLYSTISGRENNPVNYVSFWDAARFANWLHNGQPTGAQDNSTTEDGAYTLSTAGVAANSVVRNGGAQWAVTSENEWYKAAYYQPAGQGGDSDNYWLYPTSSNAAPSTAQVNISGSGFNNTRAVGLYAANYYGTFDMGGNVGEWTEKIDSSFRQYRGGSFATFVDALQAGNTTFTGPTTQDAGIGFRVTQVPAPSAVALLAFGGLVGARRPRRR